MRVAKNICKIINTIASICPWTLSVLKADSLRPQKTIPSRTFNVHGQLSEQIFASVGGYCLCIDLIFMFIFLKLFLDIAPSALADTFATGVCVIPLGLST